MADKDKTEADPLARWRTVRLTGADILADMNSLPVDVSKIEFVQATDFDRLAARVQKLEEALVHALWYVDSYTSQSTKVRAELDQILKGESE